MNQNELFLKRTDALAERLRFTLRELCAHVGLSTGSFFGYRTGRVLVTTKAWKKLEEAEIKAGIKRDTSPNLGEVNLPQIVEGERIDAEKFAALEAKVELLTRMVETLLGQTTVSATNRDEATSSRSSGSPLTSTKQRTNKKLA